jgi:hypothetical protein
MYLNKNYTVINNTNFYNFFYLVILTWIFYYRIFCPNTVFDSLIFLSKFNDKMKKDSKYE